MLKQFFSNGTFSWEHAWSEVWNVFKFGVVGVSSLILNEIVYYVLSRQIWESGPRTFEAIIALGVASIYNFSLHRAWTFKTTAFNPKMLVRYSIVVAVGAGLHGTFFYLGTSVLHWFDFYVLTASAFLVAAATYVLHRWFTFHPKYEKIEQQPA